MLRRLLLAVVALLFVAALISETLWIGWFALAMAGVTEFLTASENAQREEKYQTLGPPKPPAERNERILLGAGIHRFVGLALFLSGTAMLFKEWRS
ncbi:MAG: hypothetical protein L6413_07895 [Coriobacteriia bacterium]|nr:hypothetical protein [Coriobacteriia bacterium]